MEKNNFYKNSFTLIFSNLITGMVGFAFAILLSRQLGSEGLGLYGIIMPIYTLLICLIADGIIPSMSKNITVLYNKKEYENLVKTTKMVLKLMFFWSFIVALIVFLMSSFISIYIIRDYRSLYSIKILCPALIFVALSASLKGFFYGIGKFKVPALIDVLEKIIRVSALILVLLYIPFSDTSKAVASAFGVLAIGEVVSFSMLYTFYKKNISKFMNTKQKRKRKFELLSNVLVVSIPLGANGVFSSMFTTISAVVLPRVLVFSGLSYPMALSLMGKFSGMSLSIAMFPIIILNSISTVLIPDISANLDRKNYETIKWRIAKILKIALWLGMANLIVNLTIPEYLGELFFKKPYISNYIKLASMLSVITFLISPTIGILNGLGKQAKVLKHSLIGSSIELILIFLLVSIPILNIHGYIIALGASALVVCTLNLVQINKFYAIDIPIFKIILFTITGNLIYLCINMINNIIPNIFIFTRVAIIFLLSFLSVFYICNWLDQKK